MIQDFEESSPNGSGERVDPILKFYSKIQSMKRARKEDQQEQIRQIKTRERSPGINRQNAAAKLMTRLSSLGPGSRSPSRSNNQSAEQSPGKKTYRSLLRKSKSKQLFSLKPGDVAETEAQSLYNNSIQKRIDEEQKRRIQMHHKRIGNTVLDNPH